MPHLACSARCAAMVALLAFGATAAAHAATEIRWWHAMTDANGVAVDALARDFNATTPDFRIVPEYKGSYAETMRVGLAALDAGDAPHILQVVEIGAATMMGAHGAVKPIYELMRDARQYFDPKSYLPAITSYYSNSNGEMLGFPFNSSSLVMWVNKDALARAGLANQPLETWPQVFAAAKRLQANGYPTCGFSTSWTTWAMIEQFSAWHDTPLATQSNGIDGFNTELRINSPLHTRLLRDLVELQKTRAFDYSGRTTEGQPRFVSGECPISLTSSSFFGILRGAVKFAYDALPMPYYPDVRGAPRNSIIGGAALWVMRGKTPFEYQGVARFFAFLSETNRQAALHQQLGYLPVTRAAYEATKASGFYRSNPMLETPLIMLTQKPVTDNSRGVRLGDMDILRDIWAEEMEAALQGRKDAQAALDAAAARGNEILRAFERRVQ